MTSGVLLASSDSRSWFSATAPPTIAPAGRSVRRRSIACPISPEEGSDAGTAWIRTTSPEAPGWGGVTCAIAGSAASVAAT